MHMSDAVDPQVSQPGSTSAQATTETNCLRQLFQKLSDRKTPSHLSKGDDDTEVSQANLYPVSLKQIDAQVV